ncbi:hypothetical protein Tco_0706182 [Tanacetum coccineum]|uniref:Uncharacterized protein n=1 Tax=Tanacetum coccineum TaxID=301880 RepID=A0ABQ4Y7M0_9ASTR
MVRLVRVNPNRVRLAVTKHHKGAFDSPQHHARVFVSVVPRQQKRGAGWFSKMAPQGCVRFGLSPRAAFVFKMATNGVVGLAVISAEGCRVWDNGFRACLAVETAGEGVGLAVGQPGIAGKGRRVWLSLTAGLGAFGLDWISVCLVGLWVNNRRRGAGLGCGTVGASGCLVGFGLQRKWVRLIL